MDREKSAAEEPNWTQLIPEPVISVEKNTEGATNDTWIVRTEKRAYVMKATRVDPQPDQPFWDGLYTLFGVNAYHHLQVRRRLASFLREHSPLKIPETVRIDLSGTVYPRPFVIDEKLSGEPADFDPATSPFDTAVLARRLGEHLGCIHAVKLDYWGSFPPPPHYKLADWPQLLATHLDTLAARRFSESPDVMADLPGFVGQAKALPPPASMAVILPDLHAGQFLVQDGELSALVDIEAHVAGPRELDFVLLETLLAPQDLPAFSAGYTRHLPLPDLAPVRGLYRYLYWVLLALEDEDYSGWMERPALF